MIVVELASVLKVPKTENVLIYRSGIALVVDLCYNNNIKRSLVIEYSE